MNNYDRVLELTTVSTESAGSAQEKYNIYLESTEAKINTMESAWTELSDVTLKSGVVEFFIELATALLKAQTAMGGLVPLITTAIGLFLVIKNMQAISFLQSVATATTTVAGATAVMTAEMQSAAIAGAQLKVALGWITLALSLAYSAYSLIKNIIEENKAEQEALRESVVSSANSEIDAISKLREEYSELWGTNDKSESQQKRMAEILEILRKAYGGAETAAKDYRNELEEVNDVTQKSLLLNYQKIIETNKEAYKKAKSELSKQGATQIDVEVGETLIGAGLNLEETGRRGWGSYSIATGYELNGTYTEQVKQLQDIQTYYENLMVERAQIGKSLSDEEANGYSYVLKVLDNLNGEYTQYTEVIKTVEEAEKVKNIILKDGIDAYYQYINGVEEVTEVTEDYVDELANLRKELQEIATLKQSELDIEKEANDELEKQEKLQEKLLAVEKARVALAEAQQKKARVFRAGKGFVFETDTSAVQEAQEDLQKAESEKTKYEQEISLENKQSFIDELSAISESDNIIDSWEEFFNKFNESLDSEYSDVLNKANAFVNEYKKKIESTETDTTDDTAVSEIELAKKIKVEASALVAPYKEKTTQEIQEFIKRGGFYNLRSISGDVAKEAMAQLQALLDSKTKSGGGGGGGGGAKLQKYHSGGIVGEAPFKSDNEIDARLLKGEVVLPQSQLQGLFDKVRVGTLQSQANSQVYNISTINIEKVNDVDDFVRQLSSKTVARYAT